MALAGDRLLIGRQSRRGVWLRSVPATGGKALTLFSARSAPRRVWALGDLDASSERVAFVLLELVPGDRVVRSSVWAGSPAGPFAPVVRRRGGAWLPVDVQLSGRTVGVTEIHPTREAFRHFVFPAGAPGVRVLAPLGVERFDLAGSLVGFVEGERQLVVRDWATGVEHLRYAATGPIDNHDLAEDGRALLHVPSQGVLELLDAGGAVIARVDGGPPAGHGDVRLAGDHAVTRSPGRFEGDAHIAAIDLATGRKRRLSPPSRDLELDEAPLAVQGELVAWWANGCALVAPIAGPGATVVPRGRCPRAEIYFADHQPERLRGRTAHVRFQCVTAPPPGCRGSVRLQLERPLGEARYLIPAGRRETVRVPLTPRGLATLRREFRLPPRGNSALVGVRTTLIDGARPRSATPHQGIVLRPARPSPEGR